MRKKIIIISSILTAISLIIIIGFNILNKNTEESIKELTTTIKNITTDSVSSTTTIPITTLITTTKEKDSTIKTTTKEKDSTIKTTTKNSSTKKNHITTSKSTTTTQITTEIIDIVSVDDKFVKDNIEYKYGVKITKLNKIRTVKYSDGTIIEKQTDNKIEYDHSGYSATTDDLKMEGVTVSNKNSSTYDELLNYVNQYRREVNVSSLFINEELNLAATIRAIEMAWNDNISHTRPNGSNCVTVYDDLSISYNAWGENIALGYSSAASVSDGWKNSEGHYKNMITDYFTYAGFGKYELNGKIYWVQMFK